MPSNQLELAGLCTLLQSFSRDWNGKLGPYIKVAMELESVACWEEAAEAINAATEDEVIEAVQRFMTKDKAAISLLSEALDFDEYLMPLMSGALSAPSLETYIVALNSRHRDKSSNGVAISEFAGLGHINNLTRAKNRVLNSLYLIFAENEDFLASKMKDQMATSLFWTFAILLNAGSIDYRKALSDCINPALTGMLLRSFPAAILHKATQHAIEINPLSALTLIEDFCSHVHSFSISTKGGAAGMVRQQTRSEIDFKRLDLPGSWFSEKSLHRF